MRPCRLRFYVDVNDVVLHSRIELGVVPKLCIVYCDEHFFVKATPRSVAESFALLPLTISPTVPPSQGWNCVMMAQDTVQGGMSPGNQARGQRSQRGSFQLGPVD
eukprot:4831689-Amphidinium_carterae.2